MAPRNSMRLRLGRTRRFGGVVDRSGFGSVAYRKTQPRLQRSSVAGRFSGAGAPLRRSRTLMVNPLPLLALAAFVGLSQPSPQPTVAKAAVDAVAMEKSSFVAKGATVNWWVTNLASEPAVVTVWKTTRTLKPGERASFPYAIHSKLWVTVKDTQGKQTYSKKHSFDWVPNNHECVVNGDLTFKDLGKDPNGKIVEWVLKKAAEVAAAAAGA